MLSCKILISGGGTGGHVFPAIAIANAIKDIKPNVDILFVGAQGKLEMEKVPAAGYKIEGLNISGFQRRITWKNLLFPVKLLGSMLKARRILSSFKPDVVVGVGGYASGPVLRVAISKGIPSLIQEQNSFPGITNKLLAGKVNKICVAYNDMERYFPKDKLILTGNPVRKEMISLEGKKERGIEFFSLDKNKKTVLIIGGSLGARTINESILSGIDKLLMNDIQIIWQTGKFMFDGISQKVKQINDGRIKVCEFINKMDYAYAVADVVISRAGAIAISELCVVAKPVILVPSPNVAEDHQTKNAMTLVTYNAAVLVKDSDANKRLVDEALILIKEEDKGRKLQENIVRLAHHDAAEVIANEVLRLVKEK